MVASRCPYRPYLRAQSIRRSTSRWVRYRRLTVKFTMLGVRFLDVDFMRINFACGLRDKFFLHSRKGKNGCMERIAIAIQDGGAGAGAQHGGAGREANLIFVLPPGNPHGNRHRTRHLLNQEFMQALLLHCRQHGKKAIEKVAREQPAVYVKILALLVPREMQIEQTNRIKQMTDEEIEQAIEAIQTMLAARAGEAAKVIEGTAEPAALPAPNGPSPEAALEATLEPSKRKPNRLMMEADTAIGPRVCKTRKGLPRT